MSIFYPNFCIRIFSRQQILILYDKKEIIKIEVDPIRFIKKFNKLNFKYIKLLDLLIFHPEINILEILSLMH